MSDAIIGENTVEWRKWNQQGLIPGPMESEEEFCRRIAFCLRLEQELVERVGADLPFAVGDKASQEVLQDSLKLTQDLYGISPAWVPLFFSNYQLAPWHGGCAWIFQLDDSTPTSAFLQLRACFRHQSAYLGLYQRRELIAHELAHVGRMLYQEPHFEEILAYRSSSSSWRRWLGPVVQSSKETLFFILILGTVIMADLALLVMNAPIGYGLSIGLKLIPIALVFLALVRLGNRQRLFERALAQLNALYLDEQAARHLLYRLRDQEIELFATSTADGIRSFIQEYALQSFRWKFLLYNYPLPSD
ncbi:hypothetical protein [Candidatus Protochlamydia phocaeensis]|uniref:hypothetical protein n=1 Tax=Candidatus Protochlamydia phocaeensis TaxID=1414722 RepID=UPI000839834C|nr:hypothetical protein [Candidatus Protochlamydia phocaeensis]